MALFNRNTAMRVASKPCGGAYNAHWDMLSPVHAPVLAVTTVVAVRSVRPSRHGRSYKSRSESASVMGPHSAVTTTSADKNVVA